MKKIIVVVAALVVCVLVAAAAVFVLLDDDDERRPVDGEIAAVGLIYDLGNGEYTQFYNSMNSDMRVQYSAGMIEAVWKGKTGGLGKFQSVERTEVIGTKIDLYCAFEGGGKKVTIALDDSGLISDMLFEEYDQNIFDTIPNGLKEVNVKINAGGKWELNGKITTSLSGRSNTAAVIVQGSGAHDMDGTIGPNKIYRNLAWDLAQYDIDVLRCDKRTFVYGGSSAEDIRKFTVKEEAIDDAIAAAKLLKGLGYERVFLIGHSLGAMLAPAIVKESNGLFDGFISLAGTPRTMSEIQADQNIAFGANPLLVSLELSKLDQLDSWTESELLSRTIFGLSGYYVKDMISRDAGKIAASLDVPMLFLQGSADFQVYADKDFKMWQNLLDGKEGTKFILYDGLNHLFMVSQGKNVGTTDEYQLKGYVSPKVIRDIADFIKDSM